MRGHAGYAAEVVAVVYAIAAVVFFPTWTVDDAYIGFRYARNLAEHGQLTWNPGSRPVEGYTGIALVLLVAAGMKLGLSPVAVSQAVGLASFAAGAIVLSRFLRRLEVLSGIRIAALVLYVGAPFFLTNSLSGLETVLFSTVTLASVFALYVCAASPVASATSVAALCALLLVDGLVRPEGALLGGASLIGLAIARRHDPASRRRAHLALALLIYVLPGAVYFGWRWSYYGLLLPNTFWAKTHGGELLGLSVEWGTVDDIRGFIAGYLMLPLAAAILWLVPEADGARAALRRDGRAAPLAVTGVVTAVFASACVLLYTHARLVMNYSHRFMLPFFPLALVAIGVVADAGARAVVCAGEKRPLRWRLLVSLTLVLAALQGLDYWRALRAERSYVSWYRQLMEDEYIQAGTFIRDRAPRGEWLAVLYDSGAVPYVSGLPTIDFGGLSDPNVATLSRSQDLRDLVNYFYSFRPGVAVFTSVEPDRVVHRKPLSAAVMADARFGDYVRVGVFSTPTRDYHQVVFFRQDLVPGRR